MRPIVLVALALVLPTVVAEGNSLTVLATMQNVQGTGEPTGYFPEVFVLTAGDRVVFETSPVPGESSHPTFVTRGDEIVEPDGEYGRTTTYSGLAPGHYEFVCTVHAGAMRGSFDVI